MFRLDLSDAQRWKSATLLLVLPLFVLSIGLTGWMFHTLYPRTMLDFMQVQGTGM
jgi:cytochrome o ubiquinol oxidase operon protein cyoD